MPNDPLSFGAQYRSLLADGELLDEIRERAAYGAIALPAAERPDEATIERSIRLLAPRRRGAIALDPRPLPPMPEPVTAREEAIVLRWGRPSLLIRNGTFEQVDSPSWRVALEAARTRIEQAVARVGRVELLDHLTMEWAGTGWIVDQVDGRTIVATNRHVAEFFANAQGAGAAQFLRNVLGRPIGAQVDFREEYDLPLVLEVRVERVLYLAGPDEPDIALLELRSDVALPDPIELASAEVQDRQPIGVIGYPAHDSRNGQSDMERYFGEIFDVKRFAPGKVSFRADGEHYFVHDCTTLGGNSGSAVIDLDSGKAVGLHFAGIYLQGNFAVKAGWIRQALSHARPLIGAGAAPIQPPPPPPPVVRVEADGRSKADSFDDRDGYREDFLGDGDRRVPLPQLGRWADDVAPVAGGAAGSPQVARYRHFSVAVSRSRRQALYAAVNIDGTQLRRVPRSDRWLIDERFADAHQLGNEIYRNNDLDRGHLVRRLDPVWGSAAEAAQANADTFHYVNSAPQHKHLNQREWNDLEDYILDSTEIHDLRVSVITGPVMREEDRSYRDLVRLPREFWKVAALVNAQTGRLASAGYILSQGDMIQGITEAAFVFGEFRTYQVPIALIEAATGLSFGPLGAVDPLRPSETLEGTRRPRVVRIENATDLVF
ncbi:MAG: DNA/RNA non-specific endonuclease [Xanthomonadales bacterium]|nr:DNA/RNA non-specific endonuclease [Xanthomonadales bacterium]